jgi:hypothetical protein
VSTIIEWWELHRHGDVGAGVPEELEEMLDRLVAEADPCLRKAAPDEPVFVLRAQDELAPMVVRKWVELAFKAGVNNEKLIAADACQKEMQTWPTRKMPD